MNNLLVFIMLLHTLTSFIHKGSMFSPFINSLPNSAMGLRTCDSGLHFVTGNILLRTSTINTTADTV